MFLFFSSYLHTKSAPWSLLQTEDKGSGHISDSHQKPHKVFSPGGSRWIVKVVDGTHIVNSLSLVKKCLPWRKIDPLFTNPEVSLET